MCVGRIIFVRTLSEVVFVVFFANFLYVCCRINKPPTPHAGEYDMIRRVDTKTAELQLFFDNSDIGSATQIHLAVTDAHFNAGKPRDKEVRLIC